jgi:hypothetical protein
MAKRTGIVDKASVIDAPLPQQTKTYTPIPHQFVIDTALTNLTQSGFAITTEMYVANLGAKVASGKYLLNYGDDPEMGMMFAWSNSYDKTMRFKCAIGAYNKNNLNVILSAEMGNYNRIHKGTADKDTQAEIINQVTNAQMYYQQLMKDKEVMKTKTIDKKKASELFGRIYVEHNLLTNEQLSVAVSEYRKPTFSYNAPKDSLWCFYNHILFALQSAHPRDWMDQQTLIHWFICSEMNILSEVITPSQPSVETESSNQLSFMDMLTEDYTKEFNNLDES